MNELLLVRHGETEWSASGRHTSRTDLPLTDNGRRLAALLAPRLGDRRFGLVLTSPLRRAVETCQLAGLGEEAEVRDELREWDYGDYEGITTAEIQRRRPGWSLWRDGCPNGEVAADVGARADRLIAEARAAHADAIAFGHGHMLRVLAARWLGLAPEDGRLFALATGTLSRLGYERDTAVILSWDELLGLGLYHPPTMRIDAILATKRPVFSFEFFPPRTPEGVESLFETVEALKPLEPSFVSVTYGAGGATREGTVEIVTRIISEHRLETMAHLSCVGETSEGLVEILDRLQAEGIDNILALRGDPPRGEAEFKRPEGGLDSAAELAAFISERYEFAIGGACFPEVHPEAPSLGGRPGLPEDQGRHRAPAS